MTVRHSMCFCASLQVTLQNVQLNHKTVRWHQKNHTTHFIVKLMIVVLIVQEKQPGLEVHNFHRNMMALTKML